MIKTHDRNVSLTKKYISGELAFGIWGFISKGFGFFVTAITLSSLSLYEYGVFQLLLAMYSIFVNVVGATDVSAINVDITRYVGEGMEDKAKRLFLENSVLKVGMSVILWALFFFGSTFVVKLFSYGTEFIYPLRLLSFLFITNALTSVTKGLLRLRMQFKVVASRSSSAKAIQLVILVYFLLIGDLGVREVLISLVGGSAFSLLLLAPAIWKSYGVWHTVRAYPRLIIGKIYRTHGKWGLMTHGPTKAISYLYPFAIKWFIGTEAVAIFSAATTIVGTLRGFIPYETLNTIVPASIGDKEKMQRIVTYGTKYTFLVSCAMALIALVTVPPAIRILFPKYVEAIPLFYILLLRLPFGSFPVIVLYLQTLRRYKFLFFQKVISSTLHLLLLFTLLPFWGLLGLAMGRTALPLLVLPITIFYMGKRTAIGNIFTPRLFLTYGEEDKKIIGNFILQMKRVLHLA